MVSVTDNQQRQFGRITVERTEGNLVLGRFTPAPAFSAIEPIFRDYEEAVDLQALSVVDRLDRHIDSLGLQIASPESAEVRRVCDVQIWQDGAISFRLCDRSTFQANSDNPVLKS